MGVRPPTSCAAAPLRRLSSSLTRSVHARKTHTRLVSSLKPRQYLVPPPNGLVSAALEDHTPQTKRSSDLLRRDNSPLRGCQRVGSAGQGQPVHLSTLELLHPWALSLCWRLRRATEDVHSVAHTTRPSSAASAPSRSVSTLLCDSRNERSLFFESARARAMAATAGVGSAMTSRSSLDDADQTMTCANTGDALDAGKKLAAAVSPSPPKSLICDGAASGASLGASEWLPPSRAMHHGERMHSTSSDVSNTSSASYYTTSSAMSSSSSSSTSAFTVPSSASSAAGGSHTSGKTPYGRPSPQLLPQRHHNVAAADSEPRSLATIPSSSCLTTPGTSDSEATATTSERQDDSTFMSTSPSTTDFGADDDDGSAAAASRPPPNFAMVQSFIYRSSFPRPEHFMYLKSLGLRSVVTLTLEEYPEENLRFLEEQGIQLLQYGMPGNKNPDVPVPSVKIIDALKAVLDTRNQPVLIHCNRGKHRTGDLVASLRKMQGWSLSDTLDEYLRHSYPKQRVNDQAFIESFDPADAWPVVDCAHLPPWLADQAAAAGFPAVCGDDAERKQQPREPPSRSSSLATGTDETESSSTSGIEGDVDSSSAGGDV